MKEAIWATQNALKECRQQIIDQNEALIRAQNELPANGEYEQQFAQEIEKTDTEDYERLKKRAARKYYDAGTKKEEEYRKACGSQNCIFKGISEPHILSSR